MNKKSKIVFATYFEEWIKIYKDGAIRKVTMNKYLLSLSWVKKLAPKLKINEIDRVAYQQLLNDYAKCHERQTTMDFHHHLKASLLDAVDEGLLERDPTRKVIIKGKDAKTKKRKYLNQFELHSLLTHLNLGDELNYDWLILLIAKTGMRFSEAIALTPSDFDFAHQVLSINKTWNYKDGGGFQPTKNKSSDKNENKTNIFTNNNKFSNTVKENNPEFELRLNKVNSSIVSENILPKDNKNVQNEIITEKISTKETYKDDNKPKENENTTIKKESINNNPLLKNDSLEINKEKTIKSNEHAIKTKKFIFNFNNDNNNDISDKKNDTNKINQISNKVRMK